VETAEGPVSTSVAVSIVPGVGAAIVPVDAPESGRWIEWPEVVDALRRIEADERPRWVWWPHGAPRALVALGIRPARCWDLGAVHRMLVGGWRSSPAEIWAACHDLDASNIPPLAGAPDLFSDHEHQIDVDVPLDPSGHLRAEWSAGAWAETPARVTRWTSLAVECFVEQQRSVSELADPATALATAHSESAAEQLCAELEHDGLPIDLTVAEGLIAASIGPRPSDAIAAARLAAERDQVVLRHIPHDQRLDLRNPANVKALLRRVGVEVSDTRAWRLEELRAQHPIVDDLLTWRKAERVSTTFGYAWLDANVGSDGRLRGEWSGSDGAAGRMTATAGLHNMPADLRPAIVAKEGFVFVRADLGQIEPRILAAVSGDAALAAATQESDMYAPVAARLGVTRDIAKVAVLGAMYGQTTGKGAEELRGLESNYPVAMRYLSEAARLAEGGNDLRTRGGRLVRMGGGDPQQPDTDGWDSADRSRAAARGRYGRNAMVQGAAAEFFKTWAATVRARLAPLDDRARIVLCLHDELVVHVPVEFSDQVAHGVDDWLQEAAYRWLGPAPTDRQRVRFIADISVIARWSDAK
jgi:DNA polymerase-1